jgi:hypothetical protein
MSYSAPVKDMLFAINELAGLDRVSTLPGFEDATAETAQAVLEEAARFNADVLAPLNFEGDGLISYGLPEDSVERRMVRVESKIRSSQCHDTGKPLRLRSSRISALWSSSPSPCSTMSVKRPSTSPSTGNSSPTLCAKPRAVFVSLI